MEDIFFNTTDYKFVEEKKLGKGIFGTVYIITNIKENKLYAIKFINIEENFSGHDQMLFMRESLILHQLHHPSIVKFKGINFQSFSDKTKLAPSIITDYLNQGSLSDCLLKERQGLSLPDWNPTMKYIALLGISNAMKYLHQKGIIHRDLKPENILLDDYLYPYICDFGLSRCFSHSLSKSIKLKMTGNVGTPMYMAPEILDGDEYGTGVDVYAFGIIALEIVSGKKPYYELGDSINSLSLRVKVINGYRPKIENCVSEKMKKLILKCLSGNQNERPSFDEIYELLSNDLSYLNEDVDIDYINEYIEKLNSFSENSENNQNGFELSSFDKMKIEKKQSEERENYSDMISALSEKVEKLQEVKVNCIHHFCFFMERFCILHVKQEI